MLCYSLSPSNAEAKSSVWLCMLSLLTLFWVEGGFTIKQASKPLPI